MKNTTTISFRPRGGQDGIEVTQSELNEFADFLGEKAMDAYIPIPRMTREAQKEAIATDHDHFKVTEYYEDEQGYHGWCCLKCGKVVQYG